MTCNITLTADGGMIAYCQGMMTLPAKKGVYINNRPKHAKKRPLDNNTEADVLAGQSGKGEK